VKRKEARGEKNSGEKRYRREKLEYRQEERRSKDGIDIHDRLDTVNTVPA
jgi:hypothetical protein